MSKKCYTAAIIAFMIHGIMVFAVMRICQTDPDPSIILFWRLVWFVDLPASMIIDILKPSYNVPLAIAFGMIGGIQWGVIAASLCLLVQRIRKLRSAPI